MNNSYPIKILFLTSDPTNASRLRLGQELRDIQQRLQLAKYRDKFLLETRLSVRPSDISQAILDIEPQIVHFSGHGINTGDLCFEDELGKIHPVQPGALAALFELVKEQVNCVVLNACYSPTQAEAISQHIKFVIGMNQAIGDQAAISFAVGFYKALGANRSFEQAYKFGCAEIRLQGIQEHLTPVLKNNSNISEILSNSRFYQDLPQPIFNKPNKVCNALASQGLHSQSWTYDGLGYHCSTPYLDIGNKGPFGLANNIALYAESEVANNVQMIKLVLNINNEKSKLLAIHRFKKITLALFEDLCLPVPDNLMPSIHEETPNIFNQDYGIIELELEISKI